MSNVTYSGAPVAAAKFGGGTGIIGFDSGIILSTGCADGVVGPNNTPSYWCANGTPGDPELTTLAGQQTYDASILQFDFVPNKSAVYFQYVFGSEEYNEYVGSQYNDVFAFDVNGKNCALVGHPPQPVTINTINLNKNANLNINNDPFNTPAGFPVPNPLLNTQLDGLTRVLTCQAAVIPNVVNHIKLAIADASDEYYDSDVFLQAGSFSTTPPPALKATLTADSATTIPGGTDGYTISIANSGAASVVVNSITLTLPSGFHYLPGTTSGITSANPAINGATLTWSGAFTVPAGGKISLHLRVDASATPGSYQAQVGGTAGATPITGSGLTATITVGGTIHAVSMIGSYHGTYTVSAAGCPPVCAINGTASDVTIGLLSSTLSFQEIANYTGSPGYQCGTLTGTMTFVAKADQSQLTGTYQGTSCFAAGNPSVHTEKGTVQITGGTGRFATAGGATTFTGSRWCLPATCGINDPYHVFTYVFSGTITSAS